MVHRCSTTLTRRESRGFLHSFVTCRERPMSWARPAARATGCPSHRNENRIRVSELGATGQSAPPTPHNALPPRPARLERAPRASHRSPRGVRLPEFALLPGERRSSRRSVLPPRSEAGSACRSAWDRRGRPRRLSGADVLRGGEASSRPSATSSPRARMRSAPPA